MTPPLPLTHAPQDGRAEYKMNINCGTSLPELPANQEHSHLLPSYRRGHSARWWLQLAPCDGQYCQLDRIQIHLGDEPRGTPVTDYLD